MPPEVHQARKTSSITYFQKREHEAILEEFLYTSVYLFPSIWQISSQDRELKPKGRSLCIQSPLSNTLLKEDCCQPPELERTHTLLLMAQEIREDAVAFDCTQGKKHDPRCCLQTSRAAGSPRCGGTSAGLHGAKTPTSIQSGRFQAFLSPQDRLKRVCRGKIPPQAPDSRIQPHTDLSTPVMCPVGQDHHMCRAEDVRRAALDALFWLRLFWGSGHLPTCAVAFYVQLNLRPCTIRYPTAKQDRNKKTKDTKLLNFSNYRPRAYLIMSWCRKCCKE